MSVHIASDMTTFLATLRADGPLEDLRRFAEEHLDTEPGHDLAHALRVARQGVALAEAEGADPREVIAAALLHDIVNVPKNHPDRSRASGLSAERASTILPEYGFDPEATARIAAAIADHSFSRGARPEGPLGRVLQDADRLEALGAIGLFRCIATGVQMGASFFDAEDPFAQRRALDDRAFSVDHFQTKLLKLPETYTPAPGRGEAVRRAAFLAETLRQLGHELGVSAPELALGGLDDLGGESEPLSPLGHAALGPAPP